MSQPHCPTCAAFERWSPIWQQRRENGDAVADFDREGKGLDLAERVAWSHARLYFFHIGRSATAAEIERSRPFVCDDARTLRRAAA